MAFASAIIAGLVGVASPLSTWLVAKSQRKSERNARIYHSKLEAYNAVTIDAYRGRELLATCAEDLVDADDAHAHELVSQLSEDLDGLNVSEPEMLSILVVVAPDAVRHARDAAIETWNESVLPLLRLDASHGGYAAEARAAADVAVKAWGPPTEKLIVAMRDDLCS